MTNKNIVPSKNDAGALMHNPFAGLASKADKTAKPGTPSVRRVPVVKALPPVKLSLRLETTGRSGKVVTRILGLPFENLEAIASRLRRALGCGATVDGSDVLLLGSLVERAREWLERAGDLRTLAPERAATEAPKAPSPTAQQTANTTPSLGSGTKRSDIRPGQRVAIVMKGDQSTGALTEGIVRELLTSSATHPRGIKVRLESGEVGRVKVVFG
jgi:uncharacterized repeat protein (TIGR03833 family)